MKKAGALFVFFLATILISCGENDSQFGQLSIKLTDAPYEVGLLQAANIKISKVELRNKDQEEGSPFITVYENEETFNLLELNNGITAQLANIEVPRGNYDLVRVYVESAEIVLVDGSSFELKVPSGAQSGIKIFLDPAVEVAGGLSAELLLDFDLSRSFVKQGSANNPQGYIFKPTIKAVNNTIAGRIEGNVQDQGETPLADVEISVFAGDTLNTSTFTNDLGQYAVIGLLPGTYELKFNLNGYVEAIEETSVVVGNTTTLDVSLEP